MALSIARIMANDALRAAPIPAPLQRCDGAAEIGFDSRPRGLAHLYQRNPCRVLFPRPEAGEPTLAVLVTTAGGLTGGDRVRYGIAVGAGARATVTSQAAEKIYRSLGPDTRIDVALQADEGALLEWLPQETILFDGARLRRRTEAHLTAEARLLACEMLVFGRTAHGERFAHGSLLDGWRLHRAGRLVWADGVRLEDDIAATLDDPFAFAGATALATALYAAPDAAQYLVAARALLESLPCRAGVTLVNGVLLARLLGPDAQAVRQGLTHYLAGLRSALGVAERLPRVWYG